MTDAAPVFVDNLSLFEKQLLHHELTLDHWIWMRENGYKVKDLQFLRMMAEALANAASGAGISHSLHLIGLAHDEAAWKDGRQLKTVDEWRQIGEKWKSLHPLCRWGGDFERFDHDSGKLVHAPDADHFSIEHQGVK